MQLATLLQRSEGDTLDFKRENYRFLKGTDEEKSELLKDIVALANAWKATDAYIIVGVEESKGRAVNIIGVSPELNDSDVQQFINSKLNRPVSFGVEHVDHEGTHLTVIRVSQRQTRPYFLTRNYGRLRKNTVYIRHGSSTEEASPDEIAEMAKQDVVVDAPDVEVRFRVVINGIRYESFGPRFGRDEMTYADSFELAVFNNGNALARHIEGTLELPRGLLADYLREIDTKSDPIGAIARSEPVKLNFSNYLRTPTHSHLAKPNPLEWMPLLPGREIRLLRERATPLREHFAELDAKIAWEIAVDNCRLKKGEARLPDVPVIGRERSK